MAIAAQNATGSCKPYRTAGFPNDDCRFAAWKAMVKSGLVHIAFLADAQCGPVNIQKCQAYTHCTGNVATRGAPTTAQTSKRLIDPAEEGAPHVVCVYVRCCFLESHLRGERRGTPTAPCIPIRHRRAAFHAQIDHMLTTFGLWVFVGTVPARDLMSPCHDDYTVD